jgi:hypothetical protein
VNRIVARWGSFPRFNAFGYTLSFSYIGRSADRGAAAQRGAAGEIWYWQDQTGGSTVECATNSEDPGQASASSAVSRRVPRTVLTIGAISELNP